MRQAIGLVDTLYLNEDLFVIDGAVEEVLPKLPMTSYSIGFAIELYIVTALCGHNGNPMVLIVHYHHPVFRYTALVT